MKKVYKVDLAKLEVGNLVLFCPRYGFLLIVQKKASHVKALTNMGIIITYYPNCSTFVLCKNLIDEGLYYWIV